MLIAMLASAAAVALFGLQDLGVAVVGAAAASPQAPALPLLPLDDWVALLLPAAGIAMVGYSDNMLTARSFAARKGQDVDGNTELVALGAGNLLAGLIRGFPVSSSGSRTSIGDAQGSRTQLHSLVAVVVVVLILAFGQAVLAAFPTAALGAVVIYAAIRLIDVGEFRRIARFRWSELGIALITTVAVVVLGVLYGVIAAVAVSVVELLHRVARPHDAVLGFVPGVAGMHDVDGLPGRAGHPRPGRLPLRRAAVLRQRRGLPPLGPRGGRRRRPRTCAVVRAQRGGQRRARRHRGRSAADADHRTASPGDGVRDGAGQAGPARRAGPRRARRADRRGTDVHDAAHRRRRLPGVGRRGVVTATPTAGCEAVGMAIDPTGRDMKAFLAEAPDEPVTMLNLLRFVDGGAARYAEYLAHFRRTAAPFGAEIVYYGHGRSPVVAEPGQAWDAVLLVRYPSRKAFSDMVRDPDYQAGTHLRSGSLFEAVLQPTVEVAVAEG